MMFLLSNHLKVCAKVLRLYFFNLLNNFYFLAFCRTKPNEIYIDGGPDCQLICSTLFTPCTLRHFAPVKACYCKPTYARISDDGECISIATETCTKLIKPFKYD